VADFGFAVAAHVPDEHIGVYQHQNRPLRRSRT
jgi:hypothetical protein